MTARLFGCVCGRLHAPRSLMGGASSEVAAFPLPFYVVEHPQGAVLFDCGVHGDLVLEDSREAGVLAGGGVRVEITAAETTRGRLEALDVDPDKVRYVVLSHLHFDHAGGLHQVPNAEVVVQRREWQAGHDPDLARSNMFSKRHFDLGHKVRQIEGEHDLFGDGALTCIPSFGHTPGHQSLRVRTEAADHILTADACYFESTVQERRFPSFSDAAAMNRSLDDLLSRREDDTLMVFGHDPDQWGERPVLPTARTA